MPFGLAMVADGGVMVATGPGSAVSDVSITSRIGMGAGDDRAVASKADASDGSSHP